MKTETLFNSIRTTHTSNQSFIFSQPGAFKEGDSVACIDVTDGRTTRTTATVESVDSEMVYKVYHAGKVHPVNFVCVTDVIYKSVKR